MRALRFSLSSTWLAIPLAGCASVLVGAFVFWLAQQEGAAFIFALLFLAGAATAGFAYAWLRERDALSPLVLVCVFNVLTFGVGAVYAWFNPIGKEFNSPLYGDHSMLPWAVLLGAVALALFVAGYAWNPLRGITRRIPAPPRLDPAAAPWLMVGLLLCVGWVSRFFLIATGRYFHTTTTEVTSTGSSWFILVMASLPILCVAVLGAFAYLAPDAERRRQIRLAFWLLLAFEVAWSFPTAERAQLVNLAIILIAVHYYGTGRLPKWRLLTVGALLMVVVFPFLSAYRARGYQSDPAKHLRAAQEATFSNTTPSKTLTRGVEATVQRFSGVTSMVIVFDSDRKFFARAPGETLSWIPLGFVPRALYPAKEDPGLFGNEFGRTHGLVQPHDRVTSISTTQPGELYLNFGWLGVVLLMPVVGGAYRLLSEYLRERRKEPAALALYAVIAWQVIGAQEVLLALGPVSIFKALLVDVFALWAVTRVMPSLQPAISRHRGGASPLAGSAGVA